MVVHDVGVAQRQALDAVEHHRFAGLNDDITAGNGDGRSMFGWRENSDVTEK